MTGFLSYFVTLGPVFLVLILVVLRALTKNPWIKKRLSLSILILAIVLLIRLFVSFFVRYAGTEFPLASDSALDKILILAIWLALITALVVLIFNRFKGGSVSDRFPSIVQDAIIIGIFAVIAVTYAPEQLFATSAVGALVLGLALQDTLGNLFSGLALQIEKPFFVGDWVRLGELEGRVQEVTWRATSIRTKAGHFCVIPNTVISKDTLVNYTHPSPLLRMEQVIGFGYEAHPNKVKRVVLETFADVPEIADEPRPDVLLETYNDFSIDYRCRFWIEDFGQSEPILDKFTTLLYYRLKREGLQIPFPIRDVRMQESSKAADDTSPPLTRRRKFVTETDIFSTLEPEEQEQIARSMDRITYAADEPIIKQGHAGDSMFFIDRGTVRIVLEREGALSQVALLESGQYFGEMALLTGEARTATAIAGSDVHAFILRKEAFGNVLQEHPEIAEEICKVIAARRAELETRSRELESAQSRQEEVEASLMRRLKNFFGMD